MRRDGINRSGEHHRHLQTCCQDFFLGTPRPACDSVTVDPSARAPRRGDVIPVSLTLDVQHQRHSLPTGAKAGIRRQFIPCERVSPGIVRGSGPAKPPADAQCHTVSAELSRSGKKRR